MCFWISCDDPKDSSDNSSEDSNQDENTLDEDSVGSYQANLEDMLFYNFESNIDYAYDYYSVDGIGYGNTINLPCSIRETDAVDFYTFPEYLIEAYNCSDESIICGDDNIDYDILEAGLSIQFNDDGVYIGSEKESGEIIGQGAWSGGCEEGDILTIVPQFDYTPDNIGTFLIETINSNSLVIIGQDNSAAYDLVMGFKKQ